MLYQINPDAVDELYIVPNFDKLKEHIVRTTRREETFEFLAEIKARFLFILIGVEESHPFAHVFSYDAAMERFATTVVLMFKNEFPNGGMSRVNYSRVDRIIEVLRKYARSDVELVKLGAGTYHFDMNMSSGMLSIGFSDGRGVFFDADGPRVIKEVSFSDAGIRAREIKMIAEYASTAKSEIVFAQNKSEAIIRAVKKMRRSGLDVLSL